ncbi:extensin family protein [Pseudomonas sp. zfem002]|uniref:extensin-like domain-containing protein n=1 Tax=Pseudomonas sp. zfem002 TaxID=3078197 RepID=UPI002929D09F|nr:extensin family protein [Pseudomonas sp. zfem002]MDU9393113.1 extensin family protein [Pseudomonas sp. zfem002]
MRHGGLLLLTVLAGVALFGWWQGWRLPDPWNPWAPLDVRQPPNLLTSWKLGRLRDDPRLCAAALATSGLHYSPQADSPATARCPLSDVVRVQGAEVRLSSSFLATCPVAVAFALFQRHGLQPAAQRVFGQPVVQIDHLGSYACRNVYNRAEGRLSQHATANALDIAGFRLKDGQRIELHKDWQGDGPKAQFLREVRDGACESFNTVLGPDYNAAHHNHFHLDMGRWRVCR